MPDETSQTPAAATSEQKQDTTTTPQEKLVPESDVVKAKGGLQKQLDEVKTQLSERHAAMLQAEAKVKSLEEKLSHSADQQKELDTLKPALESTKTALEEAKTKSLTYRRQIMSKEYGVPDDTIKSMGDIELDMFEKALKVVKSNTGGGQYATGSGAGVATPSSPIDRALKNIGKAQPGVPNTKA